MVVAVVVVERGCCCCCCCCRAAVVVVVIAIVVAVVHVCVGFRNGAVIRNFDHVKLQVTLGTETRLRWCLTTSGQGAGGLALLGLFVNAALLRVDGHQPGRRERV